MSGRIKVFRLDDCDWWAGESLQACIDEARRQCGAGSYCDAESEGHELTGDEMRRLKIHRDEFARDKPITFEQHLAELIVCKSERFPQFFASTEL